MTTILSQFERLHPRSARLAQQARKLFPSGVTHDTRSFHPFPLYVERAEGSRKWDVDGNEIIDYVMGHGALLLGHNFPAVREAVAEQIGRGTHYGASHHLEIEWAQQVRELVPSAERVRFTSSGTEATMMAIRLARAFTGKSKLVKFASHFHGWHDSVVGQVAAQSQEPSAFGVPREYLKTLLVLPSGNVSAVAEALQRDDDIAAVILEPSGARMGAIPLRAAFLEELRALTADAGVVLIFDEVVTGFRLSPGGAQARYGVLPDLTCLAKILAGGLPGGAVAGRADIMSLLDMDAEVRATEQRISHPGTFNANPLSAAAGRAALGVIAEGQATATAEARAAELVRGLKELFDAHEVPGTVWAVASLVHFAIGHPAARPAGVEWSADAPPPPSRPEALQALQQSLLNHGVHTMGARCLVSSVHSPEDVEQTLVAFAAALADLTREGLL